MQPNICDIADGYDDKDVLNEYPVPWYLPSEPMFLGEDL